MTALADACSDLAEALPYAAVLTAIPDTDGSHGRSGKPGSRPPWNPAAAMAVWDLHADITEIRAEFAHHVHGRYVQAYPYAATGAALDAVERLGEAVPEDLRRWAVRGLLRVTRGGRQLPARDVEERPQRITGAPCPYCALPMLMTLPRAGIIYCKRGLVCRDEDGNPPQGRVTVGRLGPVVEWQDGLVT